MALPLRRSRRDGRWRVQGATPFWTRVEVRNGKRWQFSGAGCSVKALLVLALLIGAVWYVWWVWRQAQEGAFASRAKARRRSGAAGGEAELRAYVAAMRADGRSEHEIRIVLLRAGWPAYLVEPLVGPAPTGSPAATRSRSVPAGASLHGQTTEARVGSVGPDECWVPPGGQTLVAGRTIGGGDDLCGARPRIGWELCVA